MKNINKYLAGLLLALIVVGCEDPEEPTNFLASSTHVYFSNDNVLEILETSSFPSSTDGTSSEIPASITVTILRTGLTPEPLTVDLSFNTTWVETTDFHDAGDDASETVIIESNQVVIPAGSTSTSIEILVLDDLISAGNRSMEMTITGTSNNAATIGFPGNEGNSQITQTLSLIEDDCPIDIVGVWEGEYIVTEFVGSAGAFNEGFSPGAAADRVTTLTLDPSDPTATSVIMSGGGTNELFAQNVPLKFETCPGTVLIGEGIHELGFTQNSATATISRSDEPATFGNGTYTEDGSTFKLVVTYGNVTGSNFDEVDVTFARVN